MCWFSPMYFTAWVPTVNHQLFLLWAMKTKRSIKKWPALIDYNHICHNNGRKVVQKFYSNKSKMKWQTNELILPPSRSTYISKSVAITNQNVCDSNVPSPSAFFVYTAVHHIQYSMRYPESWISEVNTNINDIVCLSATNFPYSLRNYFVSANSSSPLSADKAHKRQRSFIFNMTLKQWCSYITTRININKQRVLSL